MCWSNYMATPIILKKPLKVYKVDYYWATISNNIYFKNKKDAQAVIDNPNFRDILDAIYKN